MPSIPSEIFEQFKTINCEEVATRLGLTVRNHKCRCFMHDDRNPSLSFFGKGRTAWNCFVCNKGGSAIQLVMHYFGFDTYNAGIWLGNEFGLWQPNNTKTNRDWRPKVYINPSKEEILSEEKTFDAEVAQFVLDHSSLTPEAQSFLFDKRKLSKDIIERIGVSAISDSAGMANALLGKFTKKRLIESGLVKETKYGVYLRLWTPCLLFPYRDINGHLIGIQSRYLGDNLNAPRFQFISNSNTHLFNLPELRHLPADETVYLSEGITDCLALLSSGKKAIGLPSATNIPTEDLPFLRGLDIVMAADNDNTGQKAINEVKDALEPYIGSFSLLNVPEGYKDFSAYYIDQPANEPDKTSEITSTSSLTELQFIKRISDAIKKRINNKQKDDSNKPENYILHDSSHKEQDVQLKAWINILHHEFKKRELYTDKNKANKDVLDILEKIQKRDDDVIRSFCHWLSVQEHGHYNHSYFLPKQESFKSTIKKIADYISMVTKIINLIIPETWNKLNDGRLKDEEISVVFNQFFTIHRSTKGVFTFDYIAKNTENLLNVNNKESHISLWKKGHKSISLRITKDETEADNASKIVNEKISSILEILKFGKIQYDKQ